MVTEAEMTEAGIKARAREVLDIPAATEVEWIPFAGRGSDRAYFRLRWGSGDSAILVRYGQGRKENGYHAAIGWFLEEIGIPVPRILHHDPARGLILQEDLGDEDLYTLRNEPWEVRGPLYRKTLEVVAVLHSWPEEEFLRDPVPLMEGFSPGLYRWERDYFREHFVLGLCGVALPPAEEDALERELAALALRLTRHRRCLVHRDLQSQNVMIREGGPVLIDYQGMRFGSRFYDLGSLLCDPYVSFTRPERQELIDFCRGPGEGPEEFRKAFWEASAQRLMQALGAYGFLARERGLGRYLAHVPPGLANLRLAADRARSLPLLERLCGRCAAALGEKGEAPEGVPPGGEGS